LAHQHEERNGGERKAGDRLDRVACQLGEAGLAAEKKRGADDVDGEEREGDRQPDPHDGDQSAEQDQARLYPGHAPPQLTEVASARRVRSPRRRWKRNTNSTAISTKATGSGASSHHSGNTRFLMVIAPIRQLS